MKVDMPLNKETKTNNFIAIVIWFVSWHIPFSFAIIRSNILLICNCLIIITFHIFNVPLQLFMVFELFENFVYMHLPNPFTRAG